jgi:peptide subunit release factor 1 (eRF1)
MQETSYYLSRGKMLTFLDELASSGEITRSSGILRGGNIPQELSLPPQMADLVATSKTGAVILESVSRDILIIPPFPLTKAYSASGYCVEPLRSLLDRNYKLALVLVRLGAYAIGVCEGETLVAGKAGTGLIHAHHKKGGSSAQRYGLHREKQIEYFITRICAHIWEEIGPRAKELDFIVYGGSREALLALHKGCPLLAQFEAKVLPPLLDIPEPNRALLEKVVRRVWSSRVIDWRGA